jgi:hypothetical protein
MPIDRFLSKHIAILRPQKKTFHILEWSPQRRLWFPYTGTIHANDIRLRKSLDHTEESVHIPVRLRTIHMICSGKYLSIAEFEGRTVSRYIPVCTKVPEETFMPSLLKYSTPYPSNPQIQSYPRQLWISQVEAPEAPAPPVKEERPKSIPPRIARILAEEAAARGEICPISMDLIRPETAHITSCYHVFHGDSIRRWLTTNTSCPVCKEVCSSYPTVPTISQEIAVS